MQVDVQFHVSGTMENLFPGVSTCFLTVKGYDLVKKKPRFYVLWRPLQKPQ